MDPANKCPCCGQAVESAGVIVSLERNSLSADGETITLTPVLAEIAFVLAKRAPFPVTREHIVERVWGMAEREMTAKNLDVQILNLRKRLADTGLSVTNVRGVGYQLTGAR